MFVASIFSARDEDTTRLYHVEEHSLRSKFQRDRDRILYSKEFRRLSGKTQVFIAGFDDHMRTRLTHTLEVSQIADTITRSLGLNEVLAEAIAYGHDVGHTPFGHVGERTLNLIMNGCKEIYNFNKNLNENEKGFKHNLQSFRVTTYLEDIYGEQQGLNLTRYTLWGILNHSNKIYKTCEYFGEDNKCKLQNRNSECKNNGKLSLGFYDDTILNDKEDWTFEAAIVAIADEIAQRHHDVEDGIYAGIIDKDDLIEVLDRNFGDLFEDDEKKLINSLKKIDNKSKIISYFSKLIVNFYTSQYIYHLKNILDKVESKFNIRNHENFLLNKAKLYDYLFKKIKDDKTINHLGFEKIFAEKDKNFQQYLVDKILYSELAQSMDGKSDFIIRQLIKAYLSNPQQLPDKTIETIYINYKNESVNEILSDNPRDFLKEKLKKAKDSEKMQKIVLRTVCEFISGMTDNYAINQYEKLYGAQKFKNY